jgi:Icc protein
MVRLAVITDIHHGRPAANARGCRIEDEFQTFVQWLADNKPDYVIEMGDRTSGKTRDEDAVYMQDVVRRFQDVPEPKIHMMGNHDADFFTFEENGAFLNRPMQSHSIDIGGFHLVFWQADVRLDESKRGMAGPSDANLEWLSQDLQSTDLKTVIFSHVPLNATCSTVNPYMDLHKAVCWGFYLRQQEIQDVIGKGRHVVACINGHAHLPAWSRLDGIHYLTVPAYGEAMATWPQVSAAFADVLLNENDMAVKIHGRDPLEFRFSFKQRGQHWLAL